MKVSYGKIVEATEDELFSYWLKAEFCEIMSFDDYKQRCIALGTKVIEEGATMPDNKLKDNEIVKTLEEWIKNYEGTYGNFRNLGNALDLINRLQAEIKHLDDESDALRADIDFRDKEISELQAENEKYEGIKEQLGVFWNLLLKLSIAKRKEKPTLEEFAEALQEYKAEAYKEFAERLDKKFSGVGTCNYGCVHHKTRKVLKELVGDNNAGNETASQRYLAPLSDNDNMLSIFERESDLGGTYFVLKNGMLFGGIVMPFEVVTVEFVAEVQRLAELCKVALDNKRSIGISGQESIFDKE